MDIKITIPEKNLRELLADIIPDLISGKKADRDLVLDFEEKTIKFDGKKITGKVSEISLNEKDLKKLKI